MLSQILINKSTMIFILSTITLLGPLLTYAAEYDLKIPGPKSYDDKIAVVGAGPSGIHMAHLLKEKGFKNVVILEKSGRIGGKSHTLHHRGSVQEMGTVIVLPTYTSIIHLINKYVPGDVMPSVDSVFIAKEFPRPLWTNDFLTMSTMEMYKTTNGREIQHRMRTGIQKYFALHKFLFGKYKFLLMPRPSPLKMYMIRGTITEFLLRYNLRVLYPLFRQLFATFGYGELHGISALYGLITLTPDKFKGHKGMIMLVKNGYQNLWEEVAKQDKLHVEFNVEISNVRRVLGANQKIWIHKKVDNGTRHWEEYDFLIWSPELKTSLHLFEEKYPIENVFSRISVTHLVSSLVDSEHTKCSISPVVFHLNMEEDTGNNYNVSYHRDSYARRHHQCGLRYQNGELKTGNDSKTTRTLVCFQSTKKKAPKAVYHKKIKEYVREIGGTNITVKDINIWRYFPKYSVSDMDEGVMWNILDMQGIYGMWYIGSSVFMEGVECVLNYNLLLTRYMELPIEPWNNHEYWT